MGVVAHPIAYRVSEALVRVLGQSAYGGDSLHLYWLVLGIISSIIHCARHILPKVHHYYPFPISIHLTFKEAISSWIPSNEKWTEN